VVEDFCCADAAALNQLGIVYDLMGRDEEAAIFYRQAAEIFGRSGDLAKEGVARSNLALRLVHLQRYEEARQELQLAIECNESHGHEVEPWNTRSILDELERATGHIDDAQIARSRAMETYLAYRRDGGASQSNQIGLFSLVAQAVQQNTQDRATEQLNNLLQPDHPAGYTALIRTLQSVLAGDRDPTLAANVELDYLNVAELRLLLDTLDQAKPDEFRNSAGVTHPALGTAQEQACC
jgi:tetratricopeptide (TPR) repeat protein